MDDLKSLAQLNRLQSLEAELAHLPSRKTPWYFPRKRYLERQIERIQFELGQYTLTGQHETLSDEA